MRWENNTVMSKQVNREFDDRFAVAGEKVGYTVNARNPVRFRGRTGDQIRPEPIRETTVPVSINRLWGQDLEISDQDLTLTIDRFGERYVEGAVAAVANLIDGELCDLYKDVYNFTGVPGTTPSARTTYTAAGVALTHMGVPLGRMRAVVVSPEMEAAAVEFGATLFNPAREISRQYQEGTMGYALGFKWSMDQNIARHTVGLLGTVGSITSNPLVKGASQSGSSLETDGWNNSVQVLNKGDIITVAGMNSVNPVSFRDNGALRTFTVTADVTSDGSGNATIPIEPPINADTESPFQTVASLPANDAAIKVFGIAYGSFSNIAAVASAQALAFHKDAFCLAIVPLELPGGMDWSERINAPKIGVSMRLTRGFDIRENKRYTRLDVLGGVKTLRPEFACRVGG